MRIKLIIFDLDGTLVDSIVDITAALNYATEPYDIDRLTVEKATGMVGEGLTRLIEKLLGEERAEILPNVLERFLSYYTDHLTDFRRRIPESGILWKDSAGIKRRSSPTKGNSLPENCSRGLNSTDTLILSLAATALRQKSLPLNLY